MSLTNGFIFEDKCLYKSDINFIRKMNVEIWIFNSLRVGVIAETLKQFVKFCSF